MDHSTIEEQRVVDRYLGGELPADDEARFEEHLFECTTCLEQVEAGEELRQGLRDVAAEDAARTVQVAGLGLLAWLGRRRGLRAAGLVSFALLAMAAGLLVAQLLPGLLGPAGSGAPPTPTADLAFVSLGAVRGAEPVTVTLDPDRPWVLLSVELPPGVAESYRVTFLDDSGRELWRDDSVEPGPYDTLTVVVPSSFLAPGEIRVRVEGVGAGGAMEIPFIVR